MAMITQERITTANRESPQMGCGTSAQSCSGFLSPPLASAEPKLALGPRVHLDPQGLWRVEKQGTLTLYVRGICEPCLDTIPLQDVLC